VDVVGPVALFWAISDSPARSVRQYQPGAQLEILDNGSTGNSRDRVLEALDPWFCPLLPSQE